MEGAREPQGARLSISTFKLTVGLTKNIGVSNFRIKDIQRILKVAKHKPVVNQIEFHPYLQQNNLRKFHAENDILTEAYAPLCPLTTKKDGPLTAVVERIAKEQGRTPAQVFPENNP